MADVVITSMVGGIGNQLYGWATAAAAASRAGIDLVLELSSYERDPFGRTFILPKLGIAGVRTSSYNRMQRAAIGAMARIANGRQGHFGFAGRSLYTEVGGRLNPAILDRRLSGRCYLRGYWQSARYFADYAGELRKAVKFEPCNAVHARSDMVCVHIRSFKEVSAPGIVRLDRDYYEKAYARCFSRFAHPAFVVYSDDLQWAKDKAMLPATYEAGGQSHTADCSDRDLCELVCMSRFQNFIIGNSSFSWWAAYLNDRSPWVQAPGRHRHAWFSEEPLPVEWEEA